MNIQLLIDSIPALIHTARPDGYLDYFNKPWLEYLGVTLDKVSGWNWTAFIHPEELDGIVARWRACLATGKIFEYETRVRRANGEYRWMFHRKVALRSERGNIVKWYGSSMDIDERKTAEVELRRSKAHLADAQRLSRTGSVGMEGSTKRIFWSEEAARIYGYPPGTEPTPDLILQRSHPDDVGILKDALERAAQGGSDFNFEHRLIMPDGAIKHIHDLTHYVRDKSGNEEIVGAIMDVTERKLAEEAIRRSEAYLAEAQRLSHTGSFGWKPDSGEIVWSEETYRIFEYDLSVKLTIDSVVQRVHPQDRADFQNVIDGASRGATDFEHAYRLLLPDARVKHVHAIAHVLQDASGNREFVGAVTDITERKAAEEARKVLSRDLQESKVKLEEAQRITHVGYWE
ncbi:MAG TPA: PAS domain-containing protein, partial [Terriglobales bacterium]|nr:PAS domain-containing protein [Terriglobales bacterium]